MRSNDIGLDRAMWAFFGTSTRLSDIVGDKLKMQTRGSAS